MGRVQGKGAFQARAAAAHLGSQANLYLCPSFCKWKQHFDSSHRIVTRCCSLWAAKFEVLGRQRWCGLKGGFPHQQQPLAC